MKNEKINEFVTSVWDKLGTAEQNKMITIDMSRLTRFQVIVALPTLKNIDKLDFIGYPVQIRKGIGAFGSDIVLLRDSNGDLSSWENQGFLILNEIQLSLINPHFEEYVKEDKEYKGEWTMRGKYPEIGWIVSKPKSVPTESSSVEITLKNSEDKVTSMIVVQG